MVCHKCSQELKEGAKFCTNCGTKPIGKASLALPIISIVVSAIGIIAPWIIRSLSSGFVRFQGFHIFAFAIILSFVGIIIALIAQKRQQSLIGFIAGVIPCVYYIIALIVFALIM